MAEGEGGSADRRDTARGGSRSGPGLTGGAPTPDEQELATRMLQIQSKRFYLDVKENRRGRFIKIAEVGAGGRKSRLLMSMSTAAEFRDELSEFAEFYAGLGPLNAQQPTDDGRLKSETLVRENRRYYLDLKENSRGRFLRVTQSVLQGPRSVVVIPAQGIVEFRDALTKLVDEFGADDHGEGGPTGELPEGRQLRAENKMFYFDVGQNNRGVFMRISEVKANFRTAITIPERIWPRFRDIMAEICEKMPPQPTQPEAKEST